MSLDLSLSVEYIPIYKDEYKKYKDGKNPNPVTFHIRAMTSDEFSEFVSGFAKVQKKPEEEAIDFLRGVFKKYIPKIENFKVKGKEIKTGEEFYRAMPLRHPLVMEVQQALARGEFFVEDEIKNSEKSS